MQEIIVLKGIHASGKTTWARKFIQTHKNYVIVCQEDLKKCFVNIKNDDIIKNISYTLIKDLLINKHNIIIDECNLRSHTFRDVLEIASKLQINCVIREKVFYCTIKKAIERNRKRKNPVRDVVIINDYHDSYGANIILLPKKKIILNKPEYEANENLDKAIICNIENILLLSNFYVKGKNRILYNNLSTRESGNGKNITNDKVNDIIVSWLQELSSEYKIVFFSRYKNNSEEINNFLKTLNISNYEVIFYNKPEGEFHNKKEAFLKIKDKYHILLAIDFLFDDYYLWKSLGIKTIRMLGDV